MFFRKKSNKLGDNQKSQAQWEKKFAFLPKVVHKDENGIETKILFGWYEERWYYERSPTGVGCGLVYIERRQVGSVDITVVDCYDPDPRLYF